MFYADRLRAAFARDGWVTIRRAVEPATMESLMAQIARELEAPSIAAESGEASASLDRPAGVLRYHAHTRNMHPPARYTANRKARVRMLTYCTICGQAFDGLRNATHLDWHVTLRQSAGRQSVERFSTMASAP